MTYRRGDYKKPKAKAKPAPFKTPLRRAIEKKDRQADACRWFLLCPNPATGTTPHPILGDVPTCPKCHKFATGKERT